MLDKVDLEQRLSKESYKDCLPRLQSRLYALEWACWKNGVPTAIVFEAWGGAGKGDLIKVLTEKLDPRGYQVYAIVPPNTEEAMKPWMARFWKVIPGKGEMAIFDRSWYGRVLWERLAGQISDKKLIQAYQDIREFESMLADDGTVFAKFWLHMSEAEQGKRLKKMEKDPMEAWKVSEEDWWQSRHYGKVVKAVEQMLDQTSMEYAPWVVAEMEDKYFGRMKVLQAVADTLYGALKAKRAQVPPEAEPFPVPAPAPPPPEGAQAPKKRKGKAGKKGGGA